MSQDLLDAYLDQTLLPAREAEFIAWLRADPEHIRNFVFATHLDSALINQQLTLAANQAVGHLPEKSSGSAQISKQPNRRLKIARQPEKRWHSWLFVGSAVLAAMVLVIIWVNSQTQTSALSNDKPLMPIVIDIDHSKAGHQSGENIRSPKIININGDVTIVSMGGKRPAKVADLLAPGEKIMTGLAATASIHYADGSQFVLAGETNFELGQQLQYVFLAGGKISAEVAPQASGSQFKIATPNALLTIIGTVFTVEAEEQKTKLEVQHGQVRLNSFDGQLAQEISAGMNGIVSSQAERTKDLEVTSFDVIDMRSLRKIRPLQDGDIIDLSLWPRGSMPNIKVNTGARVPGSLRCTLFGSTATNIDKTNSKNVNVENSPPFELVFGDNGNANHSGFWKPSGSYVLVATPFVGPKATGAEGRSVVIHFTIVGAVPE